MRCCSRVNFTSVSNVSSIAKPQTWQGSKIENPIIRTDYYSSVRSLEKPNLLIYNLLIYSYIM